MQSIFSKITSSFSGQKEIRPIAVDMHSHLLPGIDDGSKNLEYSIILLKKFVANDILTKVAPFNYGWSFNFARQVQASGLVKYFLFYA